MQQMKLVGYRQMPSRKELQTMLANTRASGFEATYADVKKAFADDVGAEIWKNDSYQCLKKDAREAHMLNPSAPDAWYLSFKRFDGQQVNIYRDIQQIKNDVVGKEHEGIMIYPATSREIDTVNQYHMFVSPVPGAWVPYGFFAGRHIADWSVGGSQTPRETQDSPAHDD
jgi:hypothetical protein